MVPFWFKGSSPPPIQREMSTEVELLQLLETSNTPSSTRPLFTPTANDDDDDRLTVADRELQLVPDHLPSTSFDVDAPGYLGDDLCSFRDQMINHHVGGHGHRAKSKNSIHSILRTSVLYHITKVIPGGKFLLAERNIGYLLGSFSLLGKTSAETLFITVSQRFLLAIRTGGVYSNNIAEEIYTQGLLWCQLPIASSLSLIIGDFQFFLSRINFSRYKYFLSVFLAGGALFASQMYAEGYVTMTDPFQQIYGVRTGIILLVPVLVANLLFAAAILSSLGKKNQTRHELETFTENKRLTIFFRF